MKTEYQQIKSKFFELKELYIKDSPNGLNSKGKAHYAFPLISKFSFDDFMQEVQYISEKKSKQPKSVRDAITSIYLTCYDKL